MDTEPARAKVNLFLHVTGRREDGYHMLDSLVVFPDIGDVLHASPAAGLSLSVIGPFAGGLHGEMDNLVLRAARALAAELAIAEGAQLMLEKRLPVASGIGGGSADAAAALRLLCRFWSIPRDSGVLARIALGLGADVPVCLASCTARMSGAGELLEPAPDMPKCGLLLVNPGVALPTAGVFRARCGPFSPPAVLPGSWPDAEAMAASLRACQNDLEQPARALCPIISEVLPAIEAQPGCLIARMSGSGATCFGLFPDRSSAKQAAKALAGRGWWCQAGSLTCGAA